MNMAPVCLHESGSAWLCILFELQENKQKLKQWQKAFEGELIPHHGISDREGKDTRAFGLHQRSEASPERRNS